MLTEVCPGMYVAKRRNIEVEGGWEIAPIHFFMTVAGQAQQPNGQFVPVCQLIAMVEVDGVLVLWQGDVRFELATPKETVQ